MARQLPMGTTSGSIAEARAAFDGATERLSGIARRKSNLRIIAVSGNQSSMYVSTVVNSADLVFYKQLGVPLVAVQSPDSYWRSLGWSDAGKYPADGILLDDRPGVLPLAAVKKIPGFAALPAVVSNGTPRWVKGVDL